MFRLHKTRNLLTIRLTINCSRNTVPWSDLAKWIITWLLFNLDALLSTYLVCHAESQKGNGALFSPQCILIQNSPGTNLLREVKEQC